MEISESLVISVTYKRAHTWLYFFRRHTEHVPSATVLL